MTAQQSQPQPPCPCMACPNCSYAYTADSDDYSKHDREEECSMCGMKFLRREDGDEPA